MKGHHPLDTNINVRRDQELYPGLKVQYAVKPECILTIWHDGQTMHHWACSNKDLDWTKRLAYLAETLQDYNLVQ